MKRIIFLLTFIFLTLTGCSNILIADNTVLPIKTKETESADVVSLTTKQPGQISSISLDKKSLYSIGRSGNTYTIDQFDFENATLVNLITSDTEIIDVAAASDGLYYLKENAANTNNIQIVWSSNNRLVERTITGPSENPQRAICIYKNTGIIYINNANELIFSDSSGAKESYALSKSLEVKKIFWIERIHSGFILAREADSEIVNLYRFSLERKNVSLDLLDRDVVDTSLSNGEDRLVYATNSDDHVRVYLREDQYFEKAEEIFTTENLKRVSFSFDARKIYFLKSDENVERMTIWCYGFDEDKLYQLTSPLMITSPLFSPSVKDQLYFSVENYLYIQPTETSQLNSYIMELIYKLPN